jgi:hypothetical protein
MTVVVVGSVNPDLVVRTAEHPTPGETVLGSSLAVLPGGKGANQACSRCAARGRRRGCCRTRSHALASRRPRASHAVGWCYITRSLNSGLPQLHPRPLIASVRAVGVRRCYHDPFRRVFLRAQR